MVLDAADALVRLRDSEGVNGPAPASRDASPVVAVMQPYVFPYLGYFSLVAASDLFVFYDDVNYIPRGWINRNRILVAGAPHTFTVPVANASQNVAIGDVATHDFAAFRKRFLRQLECAYRKAPQFDAAYALVEDVLDVEAPGIGALAMRSVERVSRALSIERTFLRSGQRFAETRGLERAARLVAITRALGASRYVNSPGGAALYEPADFAARGVTLQFLQPRLAPYPQRGAAEFLSGLSVIDALMHCPWDEVARRVNDFELVGGAA